MKSEGAKDILKWLEKKCKEQKRIVNKVTKFIEENRNYTFFAGSYCTIDGKDVDIASAEEVLQAYLDIKAYVEKYIEKMVSLGE